MHKMSPFLIFICNEELRSPLPEYLLMYMNAGSTIKLGLYNISMDNTRMLILLLSTMKYNLEITIHISKFSMSRFLGE